ncbi:MAG: substrate-binding domain-containing protein [Bacteroidota bacterium]|jgi:phosphate transport system substrate-binding protein
MRILIFAALIALLLGCSTEQKETTTKGRLHIFIPESIAPVMIDEVDEFLSLYRESGAQITYTIASSETAAHHFVQDTSRIVFLPRPLTPQEKDHAKKTFSEFNELTVAYDGIAVVVHPINKAQQMTTTEIQKVLTGTVSRWEQLAFAKPMKGIIKVYYQDSSDVLEYLKQRLLKQGDTYAKISAKITRTSSDLQTLRSVEKDPMSLGFVALDWIDSAHSKAKILNLGRTKEDTDTTFATPEETKNNFYSPHPANIYRNYYPLKRAIYMYTCTHVDLAAGFGTYVATAEGQKIFLKCGLLPGTQRIKLKTNEPY